MPLLKNRENTVPYHSSPGTPGPNYRRSYHNIRQQIWTSFTPLSSQPHQQCNQWRKKPNTECNSTNLGASGEADVTEQWWVK